jgi:glycosyltransferase involved in cell wall biosynthesis
MRAYLLAPWLMLHAQIVHVHLAAQISLARKLPFVAMARLLRRPLVVHVHAGSERSLFEQTPHWMVRFAFGSATRVIALSQSWASHIQAHHPAARVQVIPNPVDTPKPGSPRSPMPPIVLFVGKLDARKGYRDLLNAAALVLRILPDVQFWFAGQGELPQARAQIQKLGIASSIRLLGWVDPADLETIYSQATVLALPSYGEGLPMSVIEAMNRAVPVVCTPVGGLPEWIEHERNGLLVHPGDVPALAAALLRVLQNPAFAAAIAAAGQATVRSRCTLETVSRALDALYTELLPQSL